MNEYVGSSGIDPRVDTGCVVACGLVCLGICVVDVVSPVLDASGIFAGTATSFKE